MIAAVVLLIVAVVWRVAFGVMHSHDFGWLHNFAPLSAIALCGAIYLPRRAAFVLPLAGLFVSDIALNLHYGVSLITWEMAARYLALGGIAAIGWRLRRNPQVLRVLTGSVLASVLFYVVTNTASWVTEPAYAKTLAGWAQALTTGVPGFPSTIFFGRYTFFSDILFTALFIACHALQRSRMEAPAPQVTRARRLVATPSVALGQCGVR